MEGDHSMGVVLDRVLGDLRYTASQLAQPGSLTSLGATLRHLYFELDPLSSALLSCLGVAGVCYATALLTRNCSVVDRLWSLLPLGYAAHFLAHEHLRDRWGHMVMDPRLTLVATLITVWSARMTYNFWRKGGYAPRSEDYRWEIIRRGGSFVPPALFQVFNLVFIALYQNLLLLMIMLPVYVCWRHAGEPLNAIDALASGAAALFLTLEAVADEQQWAFQEEKRARKAAGKRLTSDFSKGFLTSGLFQYSRHPNFFAGKKIAATQDSEETSVEHDEEYDVYVYEAEPLEEGVAKHVLSVFVGDESGMINRVAGVFARRGANIESLAVGLTQDKALFTIVATGTDATVANLCKQLAKLVNVRYVEDITGAEFIERELFIAKVSAPPGATRTEIQQILEMFRARVVDVADRTLTISATGDPGKIVALQRALSKFGIVELVRTGRVALKRGENLFSGPQIYSKRPSVDHLHDEVPAPSEASMDGDVYSSSGSGTAAHQGVWNVKNVLDAYYEHEKMGFEPFTLLIEVEDRPGVLNQVTGVVARRGYNVQSLAVGNSEREGYSRITMVIPGSPAGIEKLTKQVSKLVYVDRIVNLTGLPHVARELMLVKVRATPAQRGELHDLAQIFHGSIIDVGVSTLTIEVTGKEDKMRALHAVLEPYGILEVARTGRISLIRDSGVDSKYLSSVAGHKVML